MACRRSDAARLAPVKGREGARAALLLSSWGVSPRPASAKPKKGQHDKNDNDDTDNPGGVEMDWNRVEGNWKQVKGKIREQWGKLTDDDLDVIKGRRDQLEGKIQERYGYAKDRVRKEVDDWYTAQRW
jgi:uncharacterized protein YjbJ (UPF0337 family)